MSTWPDLVDGLLASRDLPAAQATWAMNEILTGSATPAQTAAFLVALRSKGETPEEVSALVDAMLSHATPWPSGDVLSVDTCGTGGDRAATVNISTMAAVVVAAAGVPVRKHGNRAASSKSGSADVLEALGVQVDLTAAQAFSVGQQVGLAFLFAPLFHPALRHAGPVRREIGVRTVFNILGPLANPALPGAQAVGVADARLAGLVANVLASRGTAALVVRGDDGLDELTTMTTSTVWDVTTSEVRKTSVNPVALGIATPGPDALRGGEPAFNAAVFAAVIRAERSAELDPVRDAVLLNAAAALVAHDAARVKVGQSARYGSPDSSSVEERLALALPVVASAIDSGAAAATLERWISVSKAV